MRTPNFSDPEIIEAAKTLAANGQRVSRYTLTRQLGGGSPPYFEKALKRLIRAGKIQAENYPTEEDEIISSIRALLDKKQKEFQLEAHNEFKEDRARYENTVQSLRTQLTQSTTKQSELVNAATALEREKSVLEFQVKELREQTTSLKLELAKNQEKLNASIAAHAKIETQLADVQKRHRDDNEKFQKQRLELLDRVNDIANSSRKSIDSATRSEQQMRKQLQDAMQDGLKHTAEISKLRNELRLFDGAKKLLDKFGRDWNRVRDLCKKGEAAEKANKAN